MNHIDFPDNQCYFLCHSLSLLARTESVSKAGSVFFFGIIYAIITLFTASPQPFIGTNNRPHQHARPTNSTQDIKFLNDYNDLYFFLFFLLTRTPRGHILILMRDATKKGENEMETKIWIDGTDKEIMIDGYIYDLDQAAKLLGYVDYIDLRCQCEGVESADDLADDDEFLNFEYTD